MTATASTELLVRIVDVKKTFGAVRALRGVSVEIGAGEVVGLIGANGAGKSTLMKVLAGIVQPDSGSIVIGGREVLLRSPREGTAQGVVLVPQELQIVRNQSIAENVFLGQLPSRGGFVARRTLYRRAADVLKRAGLDYVDPAWKAGSLTPVEQRLMAIARALSEDPKVLILDEPSAALPTDKVKILGPIIRELAARGTGIVYVTHRFPEIVEFTSRVVAMRDGTVAGELKGYDSDVPAMVRLVGGAARTKEPDPVEARVLRSDVVMRVQGLCGNRVRGVDLTLYAGELVGLGGLYGSGRSELLRLLAGFQAPTSGSTEFLGARAPRSPNEASRRGIGYVAEERRRMILPQMNLVANTTVASLHEVTTSRLFISQRRERRMFHRVAERTGLVGAPEAAIKTLSGGNQQKVCVGRWLTRDVKLLLLDEPTAGIDVGARAELHKLLRSLAADGTAIVVACAEPEELVMLCERVLVLSEGLISDELRAPFDPEAVVAASYAAARSAGQQGVTSEAGASSAAPSGAA